MRILLTRATEDAERTKARLEALGHEVLVSPVISYHATGAPWPDVVPGGLIATSARAFQGVTAARVAQAGWQDLPLYLVGGRTEEAARACGFAGTAEVAADGMALCGILRAPAPAALVYFAGTERKPGIEDALRREGRHKLTAIETYDAIAATALVPDAEAAIRARWIGAVLHYSRRSASIFVELAASHGLGLTHLMHVCLSEDVAGPIREANSTHVVIAKAPTEDAILNLIVPRFLERDSASKT